MAGSAGYNKMFPVSWTELHRDAIAGAGIVANPGCYPTASLLALAPLALAGLIADVVAAIGSIDIILGDVDR